MLKAVLYFISSFWFMVPVKAGVIQNLETGLEKLATTYQSVGGNPKALAHLKCFLRKNGESKFVPKAAPGGMAERCNLRSEIQVMNDRGIAIIDFTMDSTRPRFYIFDFRVNQLRALHVGHGRFGDTDRANTVLSMDPKRNSVRKVVHFSNVPDSNATAGGFFLTGQEYDGTYGRSLVLQGLEANINDNACFRATVIHKSSYITDNATTRMSSGCPMVAVNKIDFVRQLLSEGSLIYVYTPDEAALPEDVCGRDLLVKVDKG